MRSLIIIVCCILPCSSELVGYDCSGEKTTVTPVSISDVAPCTTQTSTPIKEQVQIQVVQRKTIGRLRVKACFVSRSYLITHCGMHSHSTTASSGLGIGEILDTGIEACTNLHAFGTYRTESGQIITGHRVNSSLMTPVNEYGSISTNEGKCQGTVVTVRGRTYENVVMVASYTITLRQEWAEVSLSSSKIIISSGYQFPVGDGRGFDPDYGYLFWSPQDLDPPCSATSLAVIYQGPAQIYRQGERQTLLVNSTEQTFAVELKTVDVICGQHAFTTELTKILVIKAVAGQFYFSRTDMDPADVDLIMYTNAKFIYFERRLAGQLDGLYHHFNSRMCEMQFQVLNQQLSLAYIAPDEFAWSYTKKPGVTAVQKGEVIYLVHCHPVMVHFRQTDACYQELPVTHKNSSMFLKPKSRVLVSRGIEVECSPLAPVMYKMDGMWMKLVPEPHKTDPPLGLSAEYQSTWKYNPGTTELLNGLYPTETMEALRTRMLFPLEKGAITNIVNARGTGQIIGTQGVDLLRLVSPQNFEDMQKGVMRKMFGWYFDFSTYCSGVIGILFIFMVLKAIVNTCINGTLLVKTFGWSIHLLSAVWGTLAKHLIMFKTLDTKIKKFEKDDIEMGRLEDKDPPPSSPLIQQTTGCFGFSRGPEDLDSHPYLRPNV